MRYRDYLESRLGESIPQDIVFPRKFHVVGHVALVHLNLRTMEYAKQIGDLTLEFDKRLKSVAVKRGPTRGKNRLPSYTVVSGDRNTTTTHTERGVKFRVDPVRLTFSGGNKRERIRMAKNAKSRENVVDMFSCVGQFALHIAYAANVHVTAIEINPEAFEFLIENIELNGLENRVVAILGDCREVSPKGVADRVIMGYLHDTISYLPTAIESLNENGGMVHMHMSIPEFDVPQIIERIDTVSENYGFESSTQVHRVKNYSPGIEHFVFDIFLERNKA
ncbi:MAG: class I SAM-dependent methyltransferase family protein [Candidatus Thorarchaeota archaeon]